MAYEFLWSFSYLFNLMSHQSLAHPSFQEYRTTYKPMAQYVLHYFYTFV